MAPLFMKEISLTLKVGAATAVEFNCNVSQAMLEPEPGDVVTYHTLCAAGSMSRSADPTWTLHLIGVQDWNGTAGAVGLARFLADNAGALATFAFNAHGVAPVTASPATPAYGGTCTIVAPTYGGEVNTWAEFDVALPVSGKPTIAVTLFELEAILAAADEAAAAAAEQTEAAEAAA
jgi:hypothetical protein